MNLTLAAADAWQPLPAAEWNAEAARHLLRRAGWSALPADVNSATGDGLAATLDRLFPPQPPLFPEPTLIANLREDAPGIARRLIAAPEGIDRKFLLREARERVQLAVQDMSLKWLQYAAQPQTAAFAKWVLFLSDVYVVGIDKVKNPALVWQHFDLLAHNSLGSAPALARHMSRTGG